ncbi:MAG TPA: tyrosine-type recombinase/integrase [Jiangellales bacterium]|nr:tyrosine-type recombinase/integrase [Jiangellales bacterium]
MLRVVGKGTKVVLVPLPPAVGRAIDRAVDGRTDGPLLRNRHAATRRLRHLAAQAGVRLPWMHPHMLRHTFVTTMLDAGVDLRDVGDPRQPVHGGQPRESVRPGTHPRLTSQPAPKCSGSGQGIALLGRHRQGPPVM